MANRIMSDASKLEVVRDYIGKQGWSLKDLGDRVIISNDKVVCNFATDDLLKSFGGDKVVWLDSLG